MQLWQGGEHLDRTDPGPCPSLKPLRNGFGLEVCRYFRTEEGMLQHGLHSDHCTQTSIDFAKHRRKHTTPRADHPLRSSVAKPVDTQQRSVLIPQCQSCARIRDVTCAAPCVLHIEQEHLRGTRLSTVFSVKRLNSTFPQWQLPLSSFISSFSQSVGGGTAGCAH